MAETRTRRLPGSTAPRSQWEDAGVRRQWELMLCCGYRRHCGGER